MIIANKWESLKSDFIESVHADQRAERSRDDVYKRLGGENLRYWLIIPILIFSLFIIIYLHGYTDGRQGDKVITQKIVVTKFVTLNRSLPPTGAQ